MSHLQLNIGCPIYERPGIPHDRHSVATRITYPMAVFYVQRKAHFEPCFLYKHKTTTKKLKNLRRLFNGLF